MPSPGKSLFALLVSILLAGTAGAAVLTEIPIPGKVSVTKAGKLVKVVAKTKSGFFVPTPGSAEDPTIGGAELMFFDTSAPGAGQITLSLDSSGWKALGKPAGSKGYKYKGSNDALDPDPKGTCKSVVLKEKTILAVCKGAAVTLSTPYAGTTGMTLALPAAGPTSLVCAEFGGDTKKNDAKGTTRKNADPPAVCPIPEANLSGFEPGDVVLLADDSLLGRDNGTAGSTTAQNFLIGEMKKIGAQGLNGAASGDAAFLQDFTLGTNVIGVLPGTDLAHEYVILGAHYDHISSCVNKEAGDTICNGATDNAAGVAEVLTLARAFQFEDHRRSIVLAFWDREEDGLLGSGHYVSNPLVPLLSTVAYLNFDIQGNNLSPSIAPYSFAIAAETGGASLQASVDAAIGAHSLLMRRFSSIFGQNRSDYFHFINNSIPTVFFSDATGPCYHTNQDETAIVDFGKLNQQTRIALDLAAELANTGTPPSFSPPLATLATYDDAVVLGEILAAGAADLPLFAPAVQADILAAKAGVDGVVAAGSGAFDGAAVTTILLAALDVLAALETLDCAGFF